MREFVVSICILVSLLPYNVHSKGKVHKRGVSAGPSDFYDPGLQDPFLIHETDTGYCLKISGSNVVPALCNKQDIGQQWKWQISGMLGNAAGTKCVKPNGASVKVESCTSAKVWKCGGHRLETKSESKCLRVADKDTITLEACDKIGQQMKVYGRNIMICVMGDSRIGKRTNDPNYYFFKSPMFHLDWPIKYTKVYLVYNEDSYIRFMKQYGDDAKAKLKIRQHAIESIGILDKAYKQIKVRMILAGYEIWDKGDLIDKTTDYWQLKSAFRAYSFNTLRSKYSFDTSVYVYAGKWDLGIGGAGMSDVCRLTSNVLSEIFVMAMHKSTSAHSLAHLLSHEFGHQFFQGHHFEPSTSCPTYRMYGTRCTMGGNDWPKGFSSRFLNSIRTQRIDCLNTKPPQNKIFGCGNGIIDPGEECDCGMSEACKTGDTCCDGSICKLKPNAQCSSEICCSNCQYDSGKNGCLGTVTVLTGKSGVIETPKSKEYNIHTNWKITVKNGNKIKLFFMLNSFEFVENCPYDYLVIRDGGSSDSKILGKFCRAPRSLFLESTSNQLFITYHADNSYKSQFKLYYVSQDSNIGFGQFYLRHIGGRCVTFDTNKKHLKLTSSCKETFKFTSTGALMHLPTKTCVRPRSHGNGARILLSVDCLSIESIFEFTEGMSLLHGSTFKCLHPRSGGSYPRENTELVLYSGCDESRLKFNPIKQKTDKNECTSGTHNCHPKASCQNTDGSFNCICKAGYTGDGISCVDNNECTSRTHNCHPKANCQNTDGGFNCICKAGYTGDGTSCVAKYWIFSDKRNWHSALARCKVLGGNLASIHSDQENADIRALIAGKNNNFWIGLNDIKSEGNFAWSDDSVFDYTDWTKGEPNNSGDCGHIWNYKKKWDDTSCWARLSYICRLQEFCPNSHPYAYYNGKYCCKTNKEKHYLPQGASCDGSKLSITSMCCEGNKHIICSHPPCSNLPSAGE